MLRTGRRLQDLKLRYTVQQRDEVCDRDCSILSQEDVDKNGAGGLQVVERSCLWRKHRKTDQWSSRLGMLLLSGLLLG